MMAMDFKNMPMSKKMGLQFTASLAVAGVVFYLAKRNVASKRKAELDEYRAGMNHSSQTAKDPTAETTKPAS